jgi:hypothetical protein
MKRNFNSTIIDITTGAAFISEPEILERDSKGGVVIDQDTQMPKIKTPAKPLTLRKVALDVLGAAMQGDDNMSGEEKFKLYELANRIVIACKTDGVVDVTEDDLKTLKTRIGKGFGSFVVGPAFELLNTDYAPAANAEE